MPDESPRPRVLTKQDLQLIEWEELLKSTLRRFYHSVVMNAVNLSHERDPGLWLDWASESLEIWEDSWSPHDLVMLVAKEVSSESRLPFCLSLLKPVHLIS